MSYITPSPYRCVKCGHEFEFTPHRKHPSPVLMEEAESERRGAYTRYMPTCPQCYGEFIKQHIGLGYSTEVWTPEGSDYARAIASAEGDNT